MAKQAHPTLLQAIIPILLLMGLLALNVWLFGSDSSYGPNQIALLLAAAAGVAIAIYHKLTWKKICTRLLKAFPLQWEH